ncbi:unnamed protein product [Moneuplotes crassus]|uniref:Uncharacterized protein n=1 Tax=Euplotes crassus TaxID=5936 RepID=A0AAD1XPZ4_EUPCR|nr:unnamed protein product [Moneuplotes crassus]
MEDIPCNFPCIIVGGFTLQTVEHKVWFWAFYLVNCFIYLIVVLDFTPYYTKALDRVKHGFWKAIEQRQVVKITYIFGIFFFCINMISGYVNRVRKKCMINDEFSGDYFHANSFMAS